MISSAPPSTAAYYEQIARRFGYADKEMRGAGHARIHLRPISDIVTEPTAVSYCAPMNGHGRRLPKGLTRRENQVDRENRATARERTADELLAALKRLSVDVANRIESTPNCAAREALADARLILRGREPLAYGPRGERLAALVRILVRYR